MYGIYLLIIFEIIKLKQNYIDLIYLLFYYDNELNLIFKKLYFVNGYLQILELIWK